MHRIFDRDGAVRAAIVAVAVLMAVACGQQTPDAGQSVNPSSPSVQSSDALAEAAGLATSSTPGSSTPSALNANIGTARLEYPSNLQMLMLAFRLRNVTPPIETWAQQHYDVTGADEFSKAERARQIAEELQGVYASTPNAGFLHLRSGGSLSEYDATRQGFYISTFQPGSSFTFGAFGGQSRFPSSTSNETVAVMFDNALAAHLWPLTPDEARSAFERNNNRRDVTIDMVLRITNVEYRGNQTVLHTAVDDYTILSTHYRGAEQLGTVHLE